MRTVATLLLVVGVALTACSGMNVGSMVPETRSGSGALTTKSVRVAEVKAAVSPVAAPVMGDKLREAIVLALSRSGMFGAVKQSGEADIELRASIVSQGLTKFRGSSMELRREVVIGYDFVDAKSGRSIWRRTIQAEAGSAAFSGYGANVEAGEGSVRESLRLMLSSLSQDWPRDSR